MTDKQLLRSIQARDQKAMTQMVKKYEPYLYTVIANILGPYGTRQDIEELAQDAFYAVWTHAGAIQGNLKYYLCSTARNQAKSWLRTRKPLPMAGDFIEIPDSVNPLDETLEHMEISDLIQKSLRRMKSTDRETFLRYYFYLQTTEEIAASMNTTVGTVCSRLARGRKKLKQMIIKEGTI